MAKKAAHAKAPDFATAKLPESKVLPTLDSMRMIRIAIFMFLGKPGPFSAKICHAPKKAAHTKAPDFTAAKLPESKVLPMLDFVRVPHVNLPSFFKEQGLSLPKKCHEPKKAVYAKAPHFATAKLPESKVLPVRGSPWPFLACCSARL